MGTRERVFSRLITLSHIFDKDDIILDIQEDLYNFIDFLVIVIKNYIIYKISKDFLKVGFSLNYEYSW